MNEDQKCGLAKIAVVAVAIATIAIGVVSLVTVKNPSSIRTSVDFRVFSIEIDCQFYDEG